MENIEENTSFMENGRNVPAVTRDHDSKNESLNFNNGVAFKRQLFSSCSAIVASVSFGMTTGFTGTFLSHFRKLPWFTSNESTESWTAGVVSLSMVLGVLICTFTMRRYGRKFSLSLSHPFWICGWLLLSYAESVETLLSACFLVGLAAGISSGVSIIYISEISEPRSRGFLANLVSLAVSVGILLIHSLSTFFSTTPHQQHQQQHHHHHHHHHWRTTSCGVAVLLSVSAFLCSVFATRESPVWLTLNGRTGDARNAFLWLRNQSAHSGQELLELLSRTGKKNAAAAAAAAAAATTNEDGYDSGDGSRLWPNLFSKSTVKPFLISALLFAVQQGSGVNIIVFYGVTLFDSMSSTINAQNATIMVDTVRLVASLASSVIVKLTSRRVLFFSCALGVSLFLVGMICVIIFQLSNAFLIMFTSGYIWFLYVGLVPVPWIMSGELYPATVREIGSAICNCTCFFLTFVVVKTGLFFIETVGIAITFTIYLSIITIGVTILYFYLPETNNITLEQVEENLRNT